MSNKNQDQVVPGADTGVVSQPDQETENLENVNEDVVKYSTHKKLLNQLKSKSEELEELRNFKRQFEETEAKKKGDYEALIKSREDELKEWKEKATSYERNLIEGQKLSAFINKLPGKIRRDEYLSFVDLDEIALDPSSNRVDERSVEMVVNKFVEKYGDLLEAKSENKLPKVGSLGGRPNMKRSLKEMSREELRQAYLSGQFKD